jgi:antitoxin CcdA
MSPMPAAKRKTSMSLDSQALERAKALRINVSAVAEEALHKAIREAEHAQWLAENDSAFAAQAQWHERNGHPLADIMVSEGTWPTTLTASFGRWTC